LNKDKSQFSIVIEDDKPAAPPPSFFDWKILNNFYINDNYQRVKEDKKTFELIKMSNEIYADLRNQDPKS
jgi:hypothetical protein